MNRIVIAGLLALSATVGTAEAKPLKVVASFDILADVVANVGGDKIEVQSLVPSGGDPHEFEPSPADARKLVSADVVFVNGFGFEGWLTRLIEASGYKGTPVIASEGITPRQMPAEAEHGGHGDAAPDAMVTDPHVWNSAANVGVWIDNIEKALAAADPEDAAAFAENAARYGGKVADLDAYARAAIGSVPAEKRKILLSHDAFGYFGRDYGLAFLSPLGLSTETEASAADVGALINQIKQEGIKVYFFESSNDPRLVKQIAEATGAEPGGELYVEALSPKDGPAATYLDLFRHNVDAVVAGLRQ